MKTFRVYGVPWHTGHNHALCAMRHISKYSFQVNPWRAWNHTNRPWPSKAELVGHFDPSAHDVAILHLDHNIATDHRKRDLLYGIVETLDMHGFPRVFINHTVPHGQPEEAALFDHGHWPMVCNSRQAQREWRERGVRNTHAIIHAYPPTMFFCGRHRPFSASVLTYDSGSCDEMYDPQLTQQVLGQLEADGIHVYRLGQGMPFPDFEAYRAALQRHLVFLHTGTGCPMPRTRTEAIMCGAFCVSVRGHDFDEDHPDIADFPCFDPHQAGGADEICDLVRDRIDRSMDTRAEGVIRAGRLQGALSWEHYQQQWEELLSSVL